MLINGRFDPIVARGRAPARRSGALAEDRPVLQRGSRPFAQGPDYDKVTRKATEFLMDSLDRAAPCRLVVAHPTRGASGACEVSASVTSGEGYHAISTISGFATINGRGPAIAARRDRHVAVVGRIERLEHPEVQPGAVPFGDHREHLGLRAERQRGRPTGERNRSSEEGRRRRTGHVERDPDGRAPRPTRRAARAVRRCG